MDTRKSDFIVEFSRLQGKFVREINLYEKRVMDKNRRRTKTGKSLKLYLAVLTKVANDTSVQKAYNSDGNIMPAIYEYMAKLNWAAAMCFSCKVDNSFFCNYTKKINHLIFEFLK